MDLVFPPPKNIAAMMRLVTARSIPDWVPDLPGRTINLGAGSKHITDARDLDLPDWDADTMPVPYPDGSVSNIYAIHFLEHVEDPVSMLKECQRVLIDGGHLNVGLPYYSAQIAHHDLDHKSSWCEDTWHQLFQNGYYAKDHEGWQFVVGTNLIFGLVERNIMMITQLIRKPRK